MNNSTRFNTGPHQESLFMDPEISERGLESASTQLVDGMVSGEIPERANMSSAPIETPSTSPPNLNLNPTHNLNPPTSHFRSASSIAKALGCDKKTVHNRAKREQWPQRENANRIEYIPPHEIELLLDPAPPEPTLAGTSTDFVTFAELTNPNTRQTVLLRERAVLAVAAFPGTKEQARANVVSTFILKHGQGDHGPCGPHHFQISVRSLERWETQYRLLGIDGLVDQKQGKVGRRSAISSLDETTRSTLVQRGKAIALEKTQRGCRGPRIGRSP
jgi:hypothetical protein